MNKRVVITGIGIVSPLGCHPAEFFQRLCEGEISAGPLDSIGSACYGHEVKDFDATDILGKKGLRYLNKGTLFLASAAQLAIDSAALSALPDETGVIIGSSFGNFPQTTDYTQRIYQEGPEGLTPMESYDVALNSSINYVSVRFALKGIARTISSGFTSALDAVTDAYRMIRRGESTLLLTGGVEQISIDHYRILSLEYPFCDKNGRDIRSYGKDRIGFIPGEGSVVFVLEEFGHARERNAVIYAEIVGWGSLFSGRATQSDLCVDSMKGALVDSGLEPENIDVIVGNGNGLPDMDALEADAIGALFGKESVYVTSVKRFVGEGYGVSGGFSMAAGVMGLVHKKIPGTGLDEAGVDCPVRLVNKTMDLPKLSTVLVNSLDPHGNYSHLILASVRS